MLIAADRYRWLASIMHLNRRRQIGQHHAQRFLVLRNVVGQGTRDRILQQHFVGLEALPVHRLDLRRVEVHGQNADREQHAKDDVQERNARGNGQFERQRQSCRPKRGGALVPSSSILRWVAWVTSGA